MAPKTLGEVQEQAECGGGDREQVLSYQGRTVDTILHSNLLRITTSELRQFA